MGDIGRNITNSLEDCGYSNEYSFYSVPNGFALATRLERIEEDGSLKENEYRWSVDRMNMDVFSLSNYLKSLFTANVGYYRIIVFIVTTELFTQDGPSPSKQRASSWLHKGATKLLARIANSPYTEGHDIFALIYEFERTDDSTKIIVPGRLTGVQHLTKSGILNNLK